MIIHDRIRAPSSQHFEEKSPYLNSTYLIDVTRVISVDSDYSGDPSALYTVAVLLEGRIIGGREDKEQSSYGENPLSDVSPSIDDQAIFLHSLGISLYRERLMTDQVMIRRQHTLQVLTPTKEMISTIVPLLSRALSDRQRATTFV